MTTIPVKEKGSAFLNCFWDLVSDDPSLRQVAARGILQYLENPQRTRANEEAAKDVAYTVKRLVRGLSSSRESARLGFATCLVEVLRMPQVQPREVMGLIDESTRVTGSVKRADERDLVFGRLFGLLAVVRSGRIDDDAETCEDIFEQLIHLLHSKVNFCLFLCMDKILCYYAIYCRD